MTSRHVGTPHLIRALALWLTLSAMTLTTAYAQDKPATLASTQGDGKEEVLEDKQSEDYEELDALHKLEQEAMRPVMLDSEAWDPELLAPYRGAMTHMRREAGVMPDLHGLKAKAPRGAALCEHPAVKGRIDETRVLGSAIRTSEPELRAYLDFFDGRGKPTLVRWLQRMGRYEQMIVEVLNEEGLPEDLIYVAMIESGFSPTARSHASAVGVWQFIETTGGEMGLRIDRHVDERRDPVKATRAAARYLQKLHTRYESWPLALAAYNAGSGLMNKEIDRYNSNDYWFIAKQRGMYDETRRYVPKVIAVAMMAKNADVFGLESVIKHEGWRYDVVEVENPTRLSVIASAIGVSIKDLKVLNPELRSTSTPPMQKGEHYTLRVPEGKSKAFVSHFDKLREPDKFTLHEVRFGESVKVIAAHYGIKTRVLRAINGLGKRERVRAGEQLVISGEKGAKEDRSTKASEKEIVLVPAPSFQYGEEKKHYVYETNSQDRVEDIARAFGLNGADVAIWNALDSRAKLRGGMHLQLFIDADREITSLALRDASEYEVVAYGSKEYEKLSIAKKASRSRKSKGRKYHKVRAGQSLWTIARKHRTTVKKLKRLNPKLKRSNTLQPGDRVRVR